MLGVPTRQAPTGGVLGLGPLMMTFIVAEAQRCSRSSLTSDIGELYRYAEFVDQTLRRLVARGHCAYAADETLRVACGKYPDKVFRTQTGVDGITHSSGAVHPRTIPFWDELHVAHRTVELDIESFYVFAKILLDRWAVFVARYFGPEPGFKPRAHGWLSEGRLAGYATAKGLTPLPQRLEGQLDGELFRARRLVVDTGIHSKGWTRQQAIDYGIEASEVERYVVVPGQACAYMVGKLKLVELRDRARAALGSQFDPKTYHNTVLMVGSVPLTLLEVEVDRFIAQAKR
jgi:hypothetical protein